nr:YvcK family protein [Bacilli bacterium]
MRKQRRLIPWLLLAFGLGLWVASLSDQMRFLHLIMFGVILALLGFVLLGLIVLRDRARNRMRIIDAKKRPRVVAIGGGTGQPVLLRGLKEHNTEITAIVTVADDGGSSGRLRTESMPPPGDIRNCLVALADTEPLLENLWQYRFEHGSELSGHSFGNLFLTAMTGITGDFETAVKEASRVLAVRGRVLPSAKKPIILSATFEDGSRIEGESLIPTVKKKIRQVELFPKDVEALPEALVAIADADAIVVGPGSLYTSILPNLLVPGIAEAVRASKAKVIYICNVMTQPGETDGYCASDHVRAIYEHVGSKFFDMIIVNSASIAPSIVSHYGEQGAHPVVADVEKLHELGLTVIARNFLQDASLARHDPELVATQVLALIGREHRPS